MIIKYIDDSSNDRVAPMKIGLRHQCDLLRVRNRHDRVAPMKIGLRHSYPRGFLGTSYMTE